MLVRLRVKEVPRDTKTYFELKMKIKVKLNKKVWDAAKALLRRKCIALNSYIRKEHPKISSEAPT